MVWPRPRAARASGAGQPKCGPRGGPQPARLKGFQKTEKDRSKPKTKNRTTLPTGSKSTSVILSNRITIISAIEPYLKYEVEIEWFRSDRRLEIRCEPSRGGIGRRLNTARAILMARKETNTETTDSKTPTELKGTTIATKSTGIVNWTNKYREN